MTEFDELAWRSIHEPTPHPSDHKGLEQGGRPKNYEEVARLMEQGGDWELVIADFLHEFNFFRTADFFEKEPGEWFSCEMRAWFAGMTEYLSHRFRLPVSLNIFCRSHGRSRMTILGSQRLGEETSAIIHAT